MDETTPPPEGWQAGRTDDSGPVREFVDDYIRERIADLSDEQAWDEMRSLARLARALHETKATVAVEDVPLLGISAGELPVQRLVYWNFAKLYWNPELQFEENVHINFDWYRPLNCHRHTEPEVRAFCDAAGLRIERLHAEESGFAVVASAATKGRQRSV